MNDTFVDVTVHVRVTDEQALIAAGREQYVKKGLALYLTAPTAENHVDFERQAISGVTTGSDALFWLIDPTGLPGAEVIERDCKDV